MVDERRVSAATIAALAAGRGPALDTERAEAIRPPLASLLGRRNDLAALLPRGAAPPLAA